MDNVIECKPDLGSSGGGDACCTPLQGPEEELKGFLPKLNEVIFDFISEDPDMKTGQHKGDLAHYTVNWPALIEKMAKFTQRCLGTATLPKRQVTLEGGVHGVVGTEELR
jgi:hypothetical protein